MLTPPRDGDWIAIADDALPTDQVLEWAVLPACGAVTLFCGTVRDHSEGRPPITGIDYEAYREQVVPRLSVLGSAARSRWPMVGRLALLHRVGYLGVGDISVVVAASTPHRAESFEVARYLIDTLKTTVPIWKKEHWEGGSDWSTGEQALLDVEEG